MSQSQIIIFVLSAFCFAISWSFQSTNPLEEPIIVTVGSDSSFECLVNLIGSINAHHQTATIIVYVIDLSTHKSEELRQLENVQVASIPVSQLYPANDYSDALFKPFVVLDALANFASIFYIDPCFEIIASLDPIIDDLTYRGFAWANVHMKQAGGVAFCSDSFMGLLRDGYAARHVIKPMADCLLNETCLSKYTVIYGSEVRRLLLFADNIVRSGLFCESDPRLQLARPDSSSSSPSTSRRTIVRASSPPYRFSQFARRRRPLLLLAPFPSTDVNQAFDVALTFSRDGVHACSPIHEDRVTPFHLLFLCGGNCTRDIQDALALRMRGIKCFKRISYDVLTLQDPGYFSLASLWYGLTNHTIATTYSHFFIYTSDLKIMRPGLLEHLRRAASSFPDLWVHTSPFDDGIHLAGPETDRYSLFTANALYSTHPSFRSYFLDAIVSDPFFTLIHEEVLGHKPVPSQIPEELRPGPNDGPKIKVGKVGSSGGVWGGGDEYGEYYDDQGYGDEYYGEGEMGEMDGDDYYMRDEAAPGGYYAAGAASVAAAGAGVGGGGAGMSGFGAGMGAGIGAAAGASADPDEASGDRSAQAYSEALVFASPFALDLLSWPAQAVVWPRVRVDLTVYAIVHTAGFWTSEVAAQARVVKFLSTDAVTRASVLFLLTGDVRQRHPQADIQKPPTPPQNQSMPFADLHDLGLGAVLEEGLMSLQFPPVADCSAPDKRALIVRLSKFHGGLGAVLQWVVAALSYGYASNRTVVIAEPDTFWIWTPSTCENKTWGCYFHPLSSCTLEHTLHSPADEVDLSAATEMERVVSLSLTWEDDFPYDLDPHLVPTCDWKSLRWCRQGLFLPAEFASAGLTWFKSQLAQFAFRPLAWVMDEVERVKARIGWLNLDMSTGAGLHIRRGDKIAGALQEAHVIPIEEYVRAVVAESESKAAVHPIRWVFLATDDPSVVDMVASLLPPNLTLVVDRQENRLNGAVLKVWQQRRTVNATQEIATAITNVLLLSECRLLVGTFSSLFSRLAYELKLANGRTHGRSLDVELWHMLP